MSEQEDAKVAQLELRRTDSVSSSATSADYGDKQVWVLADEETSLHVYRFCASHKVPKSYQGPIMIDDEIFIIENVTE